MAGCGLCMLLWEFPETSALGQRDTKSKFVKKNLEMLNCMQAFYNLSRRRRSVEFFAVSVKLQITR